MLRPLSIFTILIFVTVLAVIILVGCGPATKYGDPVYTITGTVTDSVTGELIDSAQVNYMAITNNQAITDSLGQYLFVSGESLLSPLTCSKEGFVTKEIVIEREDDVYKYDNVDFQLVSEP